MESKISCTLERLSGNAEKWVVLEKTTDRARIDHFLAAFLRKKYVEKCTWITRVFRRNNYDGTITITFYREGGLRNVFVVEE